MHFSPSWQRAALAVAIAVPIAVSAQPKADDPREPSVTGPAITYHSSFSDYDAYQDVALTPWRQSNDDVRTATDADSMNNMDALPATSPAAATNKSMAPMPSHTMPSSGTSQKAKE